MEKKVAFDEVAELFIFDTIAHIQSEVEIPRLNFIFPKEAFPYFNYLKDHPFSYASQISDAGLKKLNYENNMGDYPTIYIKDYKLFFNLLKDIINLSFNLSSSYNYLYNSPRSLALIIMRRIWLRMNYEDISNYAEEFLKNQKAFLENDIFSFLKFDLHNWHIIGNYFNYDISAVNMRTKTWDEGNFCLNFLSVQSSKIIYSLPNIIYDIKWVGQEKICYISAVQNSKERYYDKKFLRLLYKLNAGVKESLVHPSSILALLLFLNLLKNKGINKVIVPTLQILSFRYHEIISENLKKNFVNKYTPDYLALIENLKDIEKVLAFQEYEQDKKFYDSFCDKEEYISKNKCENLLYMFYQLEEMGYIDILNEPFIENANLVIDLSRMHEIPNARIREI